MMSAEDARRHIRNEKHMGPTAGLASDFTQTNVVILPEREAAAFREFTRLNPKSCPVLEEMSAGQYVSSLADGSDIRSDVPKYRIYKKGIYVEQRTNIADLWREDLVTFLIGCSFTFEAALLKESVPVRHMEENRNVPMYKTSIPAEASLPFQGSMVVSMRPIPEALVQKAEQVTARYPDVHGAPVHIGNPAELGITDLAKPDYGDAVTVHPGEVPVFWACGVTPQNALLEAEVPFAITHEPGHMFITDQPHDVYKRD
ncbi:putative hydro-lyase [Sinobaca sp. H24]|uniref:putative hydro-lyase n=1 Tax=Sinobaca sp. H24 TaxID=2923376 RepID=UPI00207AC6FA|nr:putative hydro-lyase [Sinobaca sp. H24]